MGVKIIRKDSVQELRLKSLGITPPKDWGDVAQVREAKRQEIGVACSAAIYAGIDVGGSHYSLTEHDQTEIMAQYATVKEGAQAVPYHADGGAEGAVLHHVRHCPSARPAGQHGGHPGRGGRW